jgi:S1-C subfamily serine protease
VTGHSQAKRGKRGHARWIVLLALLGLQAGRGESRDALERAVVAICAGAPVLERIQGSGFIATPDGLVVTAEHVITNKEGRPFRRLFALRPAYPEVEIHELVILSRHKAADGRDIAILAMRESPTGLQSLPLGSNAQAGESVLVSGFPRIFDKIYAWPIVRGGAVASTRFVVNGVAMLVLDLAATQGFSGAPVVEAAGGTVIGIVNGRPEEGTDREFSVATPVRQADLDTARRTRERGGLR